MTAPVLRPTAAAEVGDRRRGSGSVLGVLTCLLLLVVLGQRLAVPLGPQQMPVALLAAYASCGWLLLERALTFDRTRLELFTLAAAACAAATYLGLWWEDSPLSLPSLMLLLVLYALWTLRLRHDGPAVQSRLLGRFVQLMLLLSAAAVLQMAAQYAGVWQYRDLLGAVVPEAYLLDGYNTDAPVSYLSPVYRGTAVVFLEPSFLSQYCALAVLVALVRRAPAWQVGLLLAGLAAAVSGTGLLLLAVGGAALLLRDRSAVRGPYVLTTALAVLAVLATPFGPLLLDRAGEFGSSGSSASLRFVQPYTETAGGLVDRPSRLLVGAGPGATERLLTTDRDGGLGQAVTYTTAPKLVFEYGLVAGGLFLVLLLVSMFGGRSPPVLALAVLVMTWALSGALLQPHTAVLAWLLVVLPLRSVRTRRLLA